MGTSGVKEMAFAEGDRKEMAPGINRFRLLYGEVEAEKRGKRTPNLARIIADETDFLKKSGVADDTVIKLIDRVHLETLRRWRSEIMALGSLLDPDERMRIEMDINKEFDGN